MHYGIEEGGPFMHVIKILLLKDFRLFLKDRGGLVLTFLVPMVLITLFGTIFGASGDGNGMPEGIRLLVVDEAQSELSEKLVALLREESVFTVYTKEVTADGEAVPMSREFAGRRLQEDADRYRYALVLPELLVKEDFGLRLEFLYNPEQSMESGIVEGVLQRTLFMEAMPLLLESGEFGWEAGTLEFFEEELAGLIAESFGVEEDALREQFATEGLFGFGGAGGDGDGGAGDVMGNVVELEKRQVVGQGKNPAAQSVAGWTVMFLLFSLTGAASSLFEERDHGLFQRLLAGPVSRGQILWSKFLFLGFLGCIQMVVLFGFGHILFGIFTHAGQLPVLLVMVVVSAGAATAFGMLLAAVARTPAQANGLGTFFILSLSALGGAMFPVFLMPSFIRNYVAPLSPVYWSMDGVLAVLWRDNGLVGILPHAAVLGGCAVLVLLIALWRFRRGNLFQ